MIKSLKDLLDKFSRFTNSLVYDGGICKRLNYLIIEKNMNLSKLPHPIRIFAKEEWEKEKELNDNFIKFIIEGYNLENISVDIMGALAQIKISTYFEKCVQKGMTLHEAFISLIPIFTPYKYFNLDGTILTISNKLNNLLEMTDIGDDIPLKYLRPPFKNCYIEITEDRSSNLLVFNEESGEHIFEGVYISETEIFPNTKEMSAYENKCTEFNLDKNKSFRVLDLLFTGSPVGKKHELDDVLRSQGFYIQDNDITIKEDLNRIYEFYGKDDDFSNDLDYLKKLLEYIAKVLLFFNCKEYRDTAFNERNEIEKKIQSLKSNGKIKKYTKKLRTTYNRVIIQPKDNIVYKSENNDSIAVDTSQKKAHWRRGHFRMQPYGKGINKRKIIFIEPILVGGIFAKKKNYLGKIKSK